MGLAVSGLNADPAHGRLARSQRSAPRPDPVRILLAEKSRLLRIAAGMGLGTAATEDVFQDVSVRVIEKSPHFEHRQDCVRWLVKVTVNRCLTEHRQRRTFLSRAAQILRRRPQQPQPAARFSLDWFFPSHRSGTCIGVAAVTRERPSR